jgi:hypothetical protein
VLGTYSVRFRKTGWLVPDVKIIAVFRKNHTGHIKHSVKKDADFSMLRLAARTEVPELDKNIRHRILRVTYFF